jgi:hypothetical protein
MFVMFDAACIAPAVVLAILLIDDGVELQL